MPDSFELESTDALYGLSNQDKAGLLPEVTEAFRRLQDRARLEGIELTIISAYRGFDRQLMIWNRKAGGKLAVLDDDGEPIELDGLTDKEKVFAILRWSALPAASRHHWRTDCDVYDKAAVSADYRVTLTDREARREFARLHQWLDACIAEQNAEGFFRPYDEDRGGIAPELWHLSYAPLAQQFAERFSLERLAEILQQSDLALKQAVLENLPEIYQRFIRI